MIIEARQDVVSLRGEMSENHWDAIAAAEKAAAPRTRQRVLRSLDSGLATLATTIVQYVAEIKKPDGERLAGYHDSQLESTRLRLYSPAPIYPAMDIARLAGSIELALAELGRPSAPPPSWATAPRSPTPRCVTSWWMAGNPPWPLPPIP